MNIIKNTNFRYHNTSLRTATIKYIVLHYTANNGGTAQNHIDYFNNPTTTAGSADFFVDEISKRQYNTQLDSRYSWAVGVDYSNGRAPFQGKCTNNNSISIEMCCELRNGKWYIDEKTYKNTLELTKYLMKKYNIPAERVIRHYDVCYTKHRLKTGNNPLSSCNAFNCVGRKRTYSITESINNFGEGRKYFISEPSLSYFFPNLFNRIHFRRVRRYKNKFNIFRYF